MGRTEEATESKGEHFCAPFYIILLCLALLGPAPSPCAVSRLLRASPLVYPVPSFVPRALIHPCL